MNAPKFFAYFLAAILFGFMAAIFMADGWFVPSSILFGWTCFFTAHACNSLFPAS